MRWICCLALLVAPLVKASMKEVIENEINRSKIPQKHFSMIVGSSVEDMDYQLNESTPRTPASLSKVVTAAAILRLSEGYQYPETTLESAASITGTTLNGDLILRGAGDPAFVSESIWLLVNEFKRTGVKTIKGGIIVDDSLFDDVRIDPSRRDKRANRAYDSPVSAMSFNWNVVNVFIRPGDNKGDPVQVYADPDNGGYITIKNQAKTSDRSNLRVRSKSSAKGDELIVTGTMALAAEEEVFYKPVSKPSLWAGSVLKAFLQHRGIGVKGEVQRGRHPKAEVLADVPAKPLRQLVADMQKFSNNFVAEMLVKRLSTKRSQPGNLQIGLQLIRNELQSLGLKKSKYTFINPSGLSNRNRFTGAQLYRILCLMSQDFMSSPEFMMSLPRAGIDGTLKKRLVAEEFRGQVRAKTGYLSGVIGLAGYVNMMGEEFKKFVFLYNGPSKWDSKAKWTFDRIAGRLTRMQP